MSGSHSAHTQQIMGHVMHTLIQFYLCDFYNKCGTEVLLKWHLGESLMLVRGGRNAELQL